MRQSGLRKKNAWTKKNFCHPSPREWDGYKFKLLFLDVLYVGERD